MSVAAKEQFAGFGFIQFFASVHIFSHHLWQQTQYLATWRYRAWGVSWVSCFFVLSGFKLTYSQLKRKDPEKIDPFVPYIWRRVVRLVPIYYLSIFSVWCWLALVASPPVWINLPFNLTLTFTWIGSVAGGWHAGWHGTHWYMGDLIFHQIIWRRVFFIVNRLSERALYITLVCCVILTFLRCACIQLRCCEQETTYWAPYTFHQFLSGMCLAKLHVLRSEACNGALEDKKVIRVRGQRVPMSALGAFALILLAFQVHPFWVSVVARNCPWTGMLIPLHLLLVWCITLEEGPLDWLCQRRPFNWMGELSYGVYILHWNTLMVTKAIGKDVFPEHWGHHFRFWCFLVPITVFNAFLAARYVDKPIQAWAASFLRRSTQRSHEKTS